MAGDCSILAGWLIDGTGGPLQRLVEIHVRDGLIVSIDKKEAGRQETGPIVDLSDCTVLPPLVDSHAHLCMAGAPQPGHRRSPARLPFDQVREVIAANLLRQFEHGVLAVREGGDSQSHTLRYRNECLAPEDPVRLRSPGAAWHAAGRYGSIIGRALPAGRTLADAIARQPGGADHVKIVHSGLNSLTRFGAETAPQFSPDAMKAAVRTARSLGLKTMVHANGQVPVRLAIDAGCDSIEHGFFMGQENLSRMADLQITWVPTACTMQAYEAYASPGSPERETARRTLDHQVEQVARARTLGVRLACGTDSGSPGVRHGEALWKEIGLFLKAGFPPEEAVRSATLSGAGLLGLENELGCLKPGMPASFIAFKADPLHLFDATDGPEVLYVRGRNVALAVPESRLRAGKVRIQRKSSKSKDQAQDTE